jgi:hypothetical protein
VSGLAYQAFRMWGGEGHLICARDTVSSFIK